MKIYLTGLFLLTIIQYTAAQQCKTGGCTSYVKEYPSNGAPYTPPDNWQVLINPTTGSAALMNGGNWTRFNVVQGNTYEWTYCEAYGGQSTSWDAQLTLANDASANNPICFSTDFCGTNANAPYISWVATFTGTVRVLTTAYVGSVGCQSNSGTYNKLAYRQVKAVGCTSPGTPASANGTAAQTSASLSWSASNPAGSPVVSYYWVVGTTPSVIYGNGVDQGITTSTSASTTALACGSTYYLRVFAKTSCDGSTSTYVTSPSFTTTPCALSEVLGVDASAVQGSIDWTQVKAEGKVFAFIKSTKGQCYTDSKFTNNITNAKNAGILPGAYHFALPEDNAAEDEANYFLNVAGHYIGQGYLPPVLDLENPAGTCIIHNQLLANYFTSEQLTSWVQTWLSTVKNATGIDPIIYTNGSLASYLGASLHSYKLWIADPDNCQSCSPANIGGWDNWTFKQYNWYGTVSGIYPFDLDVFNGDINLLNSLANVSSSKADLTITAGTQAVSQSTVAAGSTIIAYASEANAGTAAASSSQVGLWLSESDPLNTNTAIYLGSITSYPTIFQNSNSLVRNASITIPKDIAPGQYYLWFWADEGNCGVGSMCDDCNGAVIESDECNNFASVQITVTKPLPVKLISFDASRKKSAVLLEWKASAEIGVARYEIERSTDGNRFANIGNIDARNIQTDIYYSFTDFNPFNGNNYYRLKIVGQDGNINYSQIKKVAAVISFQAEIVPNLIRDNIITIVITNPLEQAGEITILNAEGKTLYKEKTIIEPGLSTRHINLQNLMDGLYFIQIQTPTYLITKKCVKAK